MKEYRGYPSYNCWNVCMWIDNNSDLYRTANIILKSETTLSQKSKFLCHRVRKFFGSNKTEDGCYISIKACKIWLKDNLAE